MVYNPTTGASCIEILRQVDLTSQVLKVNGDNTLVYYTIIDVNNSANYQLDISCPSGLYATLNGNNACGETRLSASDRSFSVSVNNGTDYNQTITARIRALDSYGNSMGEDTDSVTISAYERAYINVVQPSSQNYTLGSVIPIEWTSKNVASNVIIELRRDGTLQDTISASALNTGAYNWTIPSTYTVGSGYRIRVTDRNRVNISNESGVFSITPSLATLKNIVSFNLSGISASTSIDEINKMITVTVPYGTVVTSLTPVITTGGYSTISPASGVAQNFTVPKNYVVKAQNGNTETYKVTVVIGPKSSTKSITSFRLNTLNLDGVINENTSPKTISVVVPFGTSLASIAPTISVSPNATISPASGVAQNFTTPKTYTVKAQDDSTQTYQVTVSIGAGSSLKSISSFDFDSYSAHGVIDEASKNIILTVPFGTSLTSLTPTIVTSANSTISPASRIAQNFTTPKTYTVKAQDGSTVTYQVTVIVDPASTEKSITSFRFNTLNLDGVINESVSPKTITFTVPAATSRTSIIPTVVISPNATISPASGVAQNFTTAKDYTVKAQDNSTQVYRIIVNTGN